MSKAFWKLQYERSIQTIEDGGWHFNNLLTPKEISLKLRTFAHSEFSKKEFSDEKIIQNKIDKKIDLFNRGHKYKVIEFNDKFPKYLLENKKKFEDFLLI